MLKWTVSFTRNTFYNGNAAKTVSSLSISIITSIEPLHNPSESNLRNNSSESDMDHSLYLYNPLHMRRFAYYFHEVVIINSIAVWPPKHASKCYKISKLRL